MHHLHDELRGRSGSGLGARLTFGHGRDYIGRVVRLVVDGGAVGAKALRPGALVLKLAVDRFPALGFFLGIEQRELRALNHGNVGALGDFQHAQRVLGLFFHPLIAADGGDAQDVKFLGLEKDKKGLLIAGTGPARVLVDDDLDFLGGGRHRQQKGERNREFEAAMNHEAPIGLATQSCRTPVMGHKRRGPKAAPVHENTATNPQPR